MNLFGRKRYLARQEQRAEQLAEAYQVGAVEGYRAFQRGQAVAQYPHSVIDPQTTAGAYTLGWLKGYSSAQWEFEDECVERLEALGAEVVTEAELICAAAVGVDLGPQDIFGNDEAA